MAHTGNCAIYPAADGINMIIKNSRMTVEVSPMGAELMRVCDSRGCEMLWTGDPAYWKRRSPILFPNVGKTFGGVVRIGGKCYPTVQHGFARDRMFILEEAQGDHLTYLLRSDEDTLAVYPFPFELRIRYALCGSRLDVSWLVTNTGNEDMFFTIGGHPAFLLGDGESKEGCSLHFPGLTQLNCLQLDPASGTARPGSEFTLPLEDGMLPLTDALFANDALILDGGQVTDVRLVRRGYDGYLTVTCDGFPNFGIWSVPGAPFVCLEPWAGRCDDRGFSAELSEKNNVNRVCPGETFEKSYAVHLCPEHPGDEAVPE